MTSSFVKPAIACVGPVGAIAKAGRVAGIVLACALAAWLGSARTACGTVVVPAGVVELANEARAIAHGRVVRVDTQQSATLRVFRIVTVQVFDYLKGGLGNVVQIQLPGGTFGRYRTIQIGAPELVEGDEVVLFLGQGDGEALPHVLGFHQGLYRLVTDASTGERFVMPPIVQGTGVGANGQPVPVPVTRGDATRRPQTLDEFRSTIAAALKPSAGPAAGGAAVGAGAVGAGGGAAGAAGAGGAGGADGADGAGGAAGAAANGSGGGRAGAVPRRRP